MYCIKRGCPVKFPPLTFPYFNDSENFLLYISSCQFIECSFDTVKFDIISSERWAELLTGKKVVKATHCFKHSFATRTKPINNGAVNFLSSACSVEALNFAIRSCTLKIRHDHIFKATGLILSRCQSTGFFIDIPTGIKTDGHGLTNRVEVNLAGINPNNRFAYVCRLSKRSFINICFACKNNRLSTSDVFSNFFQ